MDVDLHGKDVKKSAMRVRAWASIHKIRQFQQFGGPSVTCWRECRKSKDKSTGVLENARKAADDGDWGTFIAINGGTEVNRKDQHVKLEKEFSSECGRYGEPKGYLIVGVTDGNLVMNTRAHAWTIAKRGNAARCAAPRHTRGFGHLEFCQ